MSKSKYVNFKTPRGVAKYPKLDQPYSWSMAKNRSVPDKAGQYETLMVLPADKAAPIIAAVKEAIANSGIEPENLPYKKEIDKDTKKPTGNVEFKFKAYGQSKDGKKQSIRFYDAKATPAPGIIITGGSEIKINGYVSVAKKGARLNINEIQVLYLAPSASGFDAEEDGFEYDPDEIENNKNNFDDETDTSTEGDDTDF